MIPGYVKCTYVVLYDPETKDKLFSLQKADTGDYSFCDLSGEIKDGYQAVTLNDDCTNFLADRTGVIKSDNYKKLRDILSSDRKVLVKTDAITAHPVNIVPEKKEEKDNRLIWLLLAGLLALL